VTEVLVSRDQCDDLVLAVSEAVTNAFVYGQPPIRVRMWLGADRVVIDVHDGGRGPADPLAGFLPSRGPDAESGRGLWLAHRLGIDVDLVAADDGFTVRLRAGVAAGEPSAHRFQAN
jgi:anti-sigma regulatory factor (Ser/Thr protein kinase)